MAPPHHSRDAVAGLAPRLAAVVAVAAVLAGAGLTVGGNASALAAPCPTSPGSRPGDAGRTPSRPAPDRPTPSLPAAPRPDPAQPTPTGTPSPSPTPTGVGPSTTPSAPAAPPPGGTAPDGTRPDGTPPAGALPDGALPHGARPDRVLPGEALPNVAAAADRARPTNGGAGVGGAGVGVPTSPVGGQAAAAAPEGPGASTPAAPGPPTGSGSPGAPTGAVPSRSTAPSASASPTPVASDVPCLGPRVYRTAPADADRPRVALGRGILTGASLEMRESVYRGVTKLRSHDGTTVRALQFDMAQSVTEPFRLVTPAEQGRSVVTTSKKLTISGHVEFFTTKFTGKLFGVVPVTFTPDLPPPLTLPEMWFSDVVIELALVQCDTLDADNLALRLGPAS